MLKKEFLKIIHKICVNKLKYVMECGIILMHVILHHFEACICTGRSAQELFLQRVCIKSRC